MVLDFIASSLIASEINCLILHKTVEKLFIINRINLAHKSPTFPYAMPTYRRYEIAV